MWLFQIDSNYIKYSKGANAVEVDVTFGKNGDPLYTYHGPPCDCWRHCHQQEDFNDYLRYVREIVTDEPHGIGKNLTLLFLDLKLDYLDHKAKARAGSELAKSIKENLYFDELGSETELKNKTQELIDRKKNQLRLILSVNHVTDSELINNFLHYLEINNSSHLLDRIGFDVGMNDDIQQIELMWKRFGNRLNLWQGDGYTNCFSPFYNLERLTKVLEKRNNIGGYPRKVYQWTIDLHDRMREALRLGVDAVMTNHPERLLTVLRELDAIHDYRLATREDDPFQKIIIKPGYKNIELARRQRSTTPVSGGFFGSMMDVLTSWIAYIKEIPFLSLPTTTRFLASKIKRHKQTSMNKQMLINDRNVSLNAPIESAYPPNSENDISNPKMERISASDSLDQVVNQTITTSEPAYDGPKWYVSLVSNVLVTFMKILMPT